MTLVYERVGAVRLHGVLDMTDADLVRDALIDALVQRWDTGLTVHLEQVSFMDSSGVGALVAANLAARALRRPFTVVGARGEARAC
jgi:anti-anti-sigma factor